MDISVQFVPLADLQADVLIAGLWQDDSEPQTARLGRAFDELVARRRRLGDLSGKALELTMLLEPPGLRADRLLLVGLGKRAEADRARLTDAAAAAARAVSQTKRSRLAFALPQAFPGLAAEEAALAIAAGLCGCYGPGLHKTEPDRFEPDELWLVASPLSAANGLPDTARRAAIEAQAVRLARELVNTPPCELYPESFARRAHEASTAVGITCDVLDEGRLQAERMGALLAVGRGSERAPRLVVLRYQAAPGAPTLGLVGKGVTFDSGGLSLKNTEQMVDMKCDMAGAAAVLAASVAIAQLRLPINLLGVLPLVENLPGSRAFKLGDVLATRAGRTIEVLNTDAEGRLILADALAYAVDQRVNHLVDLATLTGACMIALGTDVAGLMGNDDAWCAQVLAAADRAGERAWRLPMFRLYDDLIKSSVADMKNTGGTRYGGAISAAKLLERFVGTTPWAHLDIAGPAWVERETPARDAGATGCFVRTLIELAGTYG